MGWVVYEITGSGALLGVRAIPILLLTPLSGVAADRYDRKRLLQISQGLAAAVSLGADATQWAIAGNYQDCREGLQKAISLEMLVVHVFYGEMPRHKAEKSLRLFAEKVLPAVQAMPTPLNPASLGATGH